jgi:hypothetical protein
MSKTIHPFVKQVLEQVISGGDESNAKSAQKLLTNKTLENVWAEFSKAISEAPEYSRLDIAAGLIGNLLNPLSLYGTVGTPVRPSLKTRIRQKKTNAHKHLAMRGKH